MKKTREPSFDLEKGLFENKVDFVFGMDEVGRGSFAGPLVASAVCFENEHKWFNDLNDSKLLSAKKRGHLSKLILKNAKCFTEIIEVETINKIGIGKSNKLIFERLIKKILNEHKEKKVHFLIDGNKKKIGRKNSQFIIKGDGKVISIAAASIIAKVYRDKLMRELGKTYKGYNFSKNKGYGTKFHQEAIQKLGLCAIHRTSFNLSKFL
ncbi:MAG TPA: ribonuclease HII [Patescibacteria group bacterium]|jgi:ribonuclease HII|nr:ribonuclease HII [Patescibacteria group bacterium]